MGKSAIDNAKRGNYFMCEPARLVVIGIDTPDGVDHPLYDVTEHHRVLDAAMVANIRTYGVIQPITVRKEGDQLIVVAGRRRVLHAREAAKLQKKAGEVQVLVPCLVERDTDDVLMGIMNSENEHRRAGDSIQRKASRAARQLRLGSDEDQVCVTFGIAKNTLRNWMRLLEADRAVLKAVDDGKMSESAAAKIAALPRPKQREAAELVVAEAGKAGKGKVSQQAARAAVNLASGRAENVGLNSRRVLKRVRDEYNGVNPDGNKDYDAGVLDALNLVLGDQEVKGEIKKIATRIAKKMQRGDGKEAE